MYVASAGATSPNELRAAVGLSAIIHQFLWNGLDGRRAGSAGDHRGKKGIVSVSLAEAGRSDKSGFIAQRGVYQREDRPL